MIVSLLLSMFVFANPTHLCIGDAETHAPIVGVSLTVWRDRVWGAPGAPLTTVCTTVTADSVRVRRAGYVPATFAVSTVGPSDTVWLVPVTARRLVNTLATVEVAAQRDANATAIGRVGRATTTLQVADAQRAGVATTSQLMERLPYANVRSARGETGVSLRGARREQVVVTLDGMALNDPATGTADISDIPLVALGSATVALGADPIGSGSGASGGVVALTTASERAVSLRAGSLGQWSAAGAWSTPLAGQLWHAAVMHSTARNDFRYENRAGASDTRVRENRVNNDEARTSATVGMIGSSLQVYAMGSHSERGMVGPVNVHANDADRAFTDRLFFRMQFTTSHVRLDAGTRTLALAYRDPNRPVLNAAARAIASDIAVSGQVAGPLGGAPPPDREEVVSGMARRRWLPAIGWRAGVGVDQLHASGGIAQARQRGTAAAHATWQAARHRTEVGLRIDGVEASGGRPLQVLPSLSVASEYWLTSRVSIAARGAQAVRVPTLYDLYFSSPQRLTVKALRAERVRADVELSSRYVRRTTMGEVNATMAFVRRETRDAIVWFPGNFGWSPDNVGLEILTGADGRIAFTTSRWSGSAWFTAYDAELHIGTLTIPSPYVPRVAGGTQFVWQPRVADISVQTRTMGRRPFTAGPANPAFQLPTVTLVDVAVTRDLPVPLASQRLRASLTVSADNIGNVLWQSVHGFPSPGRIWAFTVTFQPTHLQ